VVWFTGLSGSGKSTVATRLAETLAKKGLAVEYLDGDAIRKIFPSTGYSRADRVSHIERVGYLASRLEANGVFVVASLVSPYEESRKIVRSYCKKFIEVYVSTPLEVCEQRDVKGLYQQARAGEVVQFTGISDPYEIPSDPEITFDTSKVSLVHSLKMVLNQIKQG
jgi:adenylylsulfate kinase